MFKNENLFGHDIHFLENFQYTMPNLIIHMHVMM